MAWRLAQSLVTLRASINALSPDRSKVSDGSIGDEKHASRSSDHNPWVKEGSMGVVTAIDITHDPAHGIDSEKLANVLLASKDPRIKYIISNSKIVSGAGEGNPAWQWRPYTGKNPHNHHVHISVKSAKTHYDSVEPWHFELDAAPSTSVPASPVRPLLKQGADGQHVETLQRLLIKAGANLRVDGEFGPATKAAVQDHQRTKGLVPDGVVGAYTWESLD